MNYRSTVRCVVVGLLFVPACMVSAIAQSDDCRRCVTGGGTPGTLPIFRQGSTANRGVVGNSTITGDAGGNVFLGPSSTGTITGRLGVFKGDIGGLIGWETHIDPNTTYVGVIGKVDNTNAVGVLGVSVASTGATEGVRGDSRSPDGVGVRGIGGQLADAGQPVTPGGATGVLGTSNTTTGIGVIGRSIDNVGVLGEVTSDTRLGVGVSIGVLGHTATTDGLTEGVSGLVYSPSGTAGVFRNRGGGDILVGEGPDEIHKFRFDGQGNLFLVGVLQTNSGNADLAERIDAKESLSAGDVVEIDPTTTGRFRKSASQLSTRVAGIISSAPAITLAAHSDVRRGMEGDGRPVLALAGTVPVKVTAEAGPIQVGDLLTTSSTPGSAMRCNDRVACVGAILGKALEPLSSPTGVIRALVTLQ
jgi:hypothetical protein